MTTQTQVSRIRPEAAQSVAARTRPMESATLLGSRGELEISHQGEIYRLRRTRQGKLILTK
jgi:hemin uptake protein HemP